MRPGDRGLKRVRLHGNPVTFGKASRTRTEIYLRCYLLQYKIFNTTTRFLMFCDSSRLSGLISNF